MWEKKNESNKKQKTKKNTKQKSYMRSEKDE